MTDRGRVSIEKGKGICVRESKEEERLRGRKKSKNQGQRQKGLENNQGEVRL